MSAPVALAAVAAAANAVVVLGCAQKLVLLLLPPCTGIAQTKQLKQQLGVLLLAIVVVVNDDRDRLVIFVEIAREIMID